MQDKTSSLAQAIGRIRDGDSVMIGGFGIPGTPFTLLEELQRQGQSGLTLIKNDANEAGMGVDWLLASGQVKRLIVSHIGLNPNANVLMHSGQLEVEFCAQGILAERIRCAGAGLKGFITDIGIDTFLQEGKPTLEYAGQPCLIESALQADVALLHAARADRFGNLQYAASAQNFNPLMASAGKTVIVEAEALYEIGEMEPEQVHTPGAFVDAVVELVDLPEVYHVKQR